MTGGRGPFFQGDDGRRGCSLADRMYALRRMSYAILEACVGRGDFLVGVFGRGQGTVYRVFATGGVLLTWMV